MGAGIPKQFIEVDKRCIIEYTIDAFDCCDEVDEVCVVVHPEWVDFAGQVVNRNQWEKVRKVVAGGSERYMSTLEAIRAFESEPDEDKFILHDAVRPMVKGLQVASVIEALDHCDAAGVAVPCTDTIWRVQGGTIESIPDRSQLMRAQTPQGFRLGVLRKAYDRALQGGPIPVTDDCGMVLRYVPEVEVRVVLGDESNIKVTYPRDLELAKTALGPKEKNC